MKSALSVLLLCFVLASCGEEKTVDAELIETEKTIQERAEAGDVVAQYNLGVMYDNGEGVPEDDVEAVKWFRKAAEQDYAMAQHNLGNMYHTGEGGPKDYAKAYMFFNLAAAKDFEISKKYRDFIEKRMTKEQIAEGEKLTREWVARKAKEKGQ